MEYQILLLYDDINQINLLELLINKYKTISGISINTISFTYAEHAKRKLESLEKIDAFFLDIALTDDSLNDDGIKFAQYLRKMPQYHDTPIIFITACGFRMSEAVNNLHCYAFLLKPFTVNDFYRQLNDIFMNKHYHILIRGTDGIYRRIFTEQLIYIHSCGRYIQYFTSEGIFHSRQFRMKELLLKLPKNFFRCHKSYIINKSYVYNYDFTNHFVHLSTLAEPIPLSRHFNSNNILTDKIFK